MNFSWNMLTAENAFGPSWEVRMSGVARARASSATPTAGP
jgi:hypothetical protein